jgi:hypothetical protein
VAAVSTVCSQKCGSFEVGPVKSHLKTAAMIDLLQPIATERDVLFSIA